MARVLEHLVKERELPCERVVLLHPHRLPNSPFAGGARIGAYSLAEKPVAGQRNVIRFSTIRGFKGLESDCVILSGIREGDDRCTGTDLYVGASRAKHILHMIRRTDPVPE